MGRAGPRGLRGDCWPSSPGPKRLRENYGSQIASIMCIGIPALEVSQRHERPLDGDQAGDDLDGLRRALVGIRPAGDLVEVVPDAGDLPVAHLVGMVRLLRSPVPETTTGTRAAPPRSRTSSAAGSVASWPAASRARSRKPGSSRQPAHAPLRESHVPDRTAAPDAPTPPSSGLRESSTRPSLDPSRSTPHHGSRRPAPQSAP